MKKTHTLLNPRIGSTFKALFTQDTPASREALRAFLAAATERPITSVELSARDAPIGTNTQPNAGCNIICKCDDGLAVNIEMQTCNPNYDYATRAAYQVALLEAPYIRESIFWDLMPPAFQITVLDCACAAKDDGETPKAAEQSPVSRYAMRTADGRELIENTLNVIFIDLSKTAPLQASIETNTPLENWAIFLKNADNPARQDIIQKLVEKEAGLLQARESLASISENQAQRIAQYRQEIFERDMRSGLSAARQEGLKAGLEEKAVQIAKKYMALGHSAQEAAEFAEIDVGLLR